MQMGELIVTYEGEVKIDLQSHPNNIRVFFEDISVVNTCNPHHHDHLHWHIKHEHAHHKHDHHHDHCKHDEHFILVIKWKVHNIRSIKWIINY